MNETTRQTLENFVRGSLGCQCPDKVFEHIEYNVNASLFKKVLLNEEYEQSCIINVGGILLILKISLCLAQAQSLNLSKICQQGKTERDRLGFNRFRLVIATDEPVALKTLLLPEFNKIIGDDEKMHLHTVAYDALHMPE